MIKEHYAMNYRNRSLVAIAILLYGLILSVLLCAVPVSAVDYTGSLNPIIPVSQISTINTVNGGAWLDTPYHMGWATDFDSVGIPSVYVIYFNVDHYCTGTTTFTLSDDLGVYATGTLDAGNGTVLYQGAHQYFVLNFASWSSGTRSGIIFGNITIPAGSLSGDRFVGSARGEMSVVPMGLINPTLVAGVWAGDAGSIYTPKPYTTKYDYTITGFGGTGTILMSEVSLSRPSNNLGTNVRAYNATTGALLYQSIKTDSISSEDFFVVGSNYVLSMYVPLTGAIYNSSVFYTATTPTPTPTPIPGAILNLDVRDITTHSTIGGAHVGILNVTSGLWRNTTTPTGLVYYDSTDVAPELPLKIGQTVTLNAWAYGYKNTSDNYVTVTIPYSGYTSTIILTPDTVVNATGTFWLTVRLTDNANGLPIGNGYVRLITGGVESLQGTDSTGYTVFENKTASTTFSVEAFAQVYDSQTKVLPVTGDYMTTSFSLVRKGAIPYTTPINPVTTRTTAPVVTWTNTGGQPLSEQEGSALDAFNQISRSLESWFNIGAGIITIWLLWILVYELTGGKVIDKLMRRGRR